MFEWDDAKAKSNLAKHSVTFENAATAFADKMSLTIADPLHSHGESRLILLGSSASGEILVVVHTERGENVRIISARRASRRERQTYEEAR